MTEVDVHNFELASQLYETIDRMVWGGMAGLMAMRRYIERHGELPAGVHRMIV